MSGTERQSDLIVLDDIAVISMVGAEALPQVHKTVFVEREMVSLIVDHGQLAIPEGAHVIKGSGKFLMPGLIDCHVHIRSEKDLPQFIANGVTTVANMWGFEGLKTKLLSVPNTLKLREDVSFGDVVSPMIYTAGPILEGKPRAQPFMDEITSPEKARKEVERQIEEGYDFLKVYDNLSLDVYTAIMEVARKKGIKVRGHVPLAVGLTGALEQRQFSIEHLTGYIDPDAAEFLIPEIKIHSFAEMTREAGVWNCPTLIVWQKLVGMDKYDEMTKHPAMKHLSQWQRVFLKKSFSEMMKKIKYTGADYTKRMLEISSVLIKALHGAGARLILGTDAGNPFVWPGYSVHEELKLLVKAGLSPYEALKTATVSAAESLGRQNVIGTVAPGKRADLLVVEDNPLADISNTSKIFGVVVEGRWFPKEELASLI
ncbi:MAG: amidohydrolase family protein [Promethearchaeota archaeon]